MTPAEMVATRADELLVKYDITEAAIAETKDRYAALSADTPQGYEAVRLAIAEVRATRVSIEKRRVELKAGALEYGRRVDAEAKRFTALLEAIEDPLKAKKDAVDQEKARAKAAEEAARIAKIEEEIRAKREAEEAQRRALQAEEDARRRAQQQLEAEQLEAQRKEIARMQQEMAAQQQAFEAAQLKAEAEARRAKAEADAKVEAAELAQRLIAERERQLRQQEEAREREAREKAAREEAERQHQLEIALHEELMEAMRPDMAKLRGFAKRIRAVKVPTDLVSQASVDAVNSAVTQIESAMVELLRYTGENDGE